MEDISLLLSYIETEVEGGKKAFMGGGVVVNGEAILLLVKRIRQQLAAINGQKILAEAEAQAKQILAEAEQRKANILNENIIISEAKVIAEHTVDVALQRKKEVEEQLKNNLLKMLSDVNASLECAKGTIKSLMDRLDA